MGNRRLRILVVTERFFPEDFIINDLAREWAAQGHQVDVLTQAPSYPFDRIFPGYTNGLFRKDHWGGLGIYRLFTVLGYKKHLSFKLLHYLLFAILGSVAALCIGRRYDRIFVYQLGPLTDAIHAVLIRKLLRKDMTIWVQDVWPDSVYAYGFKKSRLLSAFLGALVRATYAACDRIFISCEGFRRQVRPYAPGKPIHHFPNWPVVDASAPSGRGIRLSDRFNFTFAGNVGKVQNLENVIAGFARFSRSRDDSQLNIIGDGSHLEELKALVAADKVANVVFWGRQKLEDMPSYFAASDILIVSLKDSPIFELTVPAKFQTYLTTGKPIFCITKGETRDIVEKHDLGRGADPEDITDIAAGFLALREAPKEELAACGRRMKAVLDDSFSRDKIIKGMTAQMAAGGASEDAGRDDRSVNLSGAG